MASLTWLGHSAFLLVERRGQADLRRPVPEREPDDARGRSRAPSRSTSSRSPTVTATTSATRSRSRRPSRDAADRRAGRAQDAGSARRARTSATLPGLNKGGTQEIDGIHFTLVNAFHSSSSDEGEYLGEACGHRDPARGRPRRVLRRRHLRLRRHGADRAALRAGLRRAADRRPLHDGAARGRGRARAARQPAVHSVPLRHVPAPDRHARSSFRPRRRTRPSTSSSPATRCCSTDRDGAGRRDVLDRRLRPRRGAVGRRDRVEVPRRRLGRAVGPARRRRDRDAGVREPTLRAGRAARCSREGLPAAEVVARLTDADDGRDHRQLGVVDAEGGSATYTGSECMDWAGGVSGPCFAAQGNILVSEETVAAIASTFEASAGPAARRAADRLPRRSAGGRRRPARPAVGGAARRRARRRLRGPVGLGRRPPRRRPPGPGRGARAALRDPPDAVRQDAAQPTGSRSTARSAAELERAARRGSASRASSRRRCPPGRAARTSRSASTGSRGSTRSCSRSCGAR